MFTRCAVVRTAGEFQLAQNRRRNEDEIRAPVLHVRRFRLPGVDRFSFPKTDRDQPVRRDSLADERVHHDGGPPRREAGVVADRAANVRMPLDEQ